MSIYSVKQMAMRHPAFTESTLRNYIAEAKKTGFETCLIRPPNIKRVFIDEEQFLIWLRSGKSLTTQTSILSNT